MDHALRTVLLPAAHRIDIITAWVGRGAAWLVLIACLLSVSNALLRFGAHFALPALLDVPVLLFAGIVLLAAPRTLAENSHIRVDILYRSLAQRRRAVIDILGNLVFLAPFCLLMIIESVPVFASSWRIGEGSITPGGLPQWAAKALIPAGFALLLLQALSEIVKAIGALRGVVWPPPGLNAMSTSEDAPALRSSGAP
ncbi:MAG: TRAP transporter small permease subunit [Hyphomicrobiales bacterium]|nr:TRAP transporter small permease subunit [Hyphomicrobiales bacterium]MBV9975729.1 TRAP transporter small permease subunit [Hyphomicrobiales bacterium]